MKVPRCPNKCLLVLALVSSLSGPSLTAEAATVVHTNSVQLTTAHSVVAQNLGTKIDFHDPAGCNLPLFNPSLGPRLAWRRATCASLPCS